MTTSKIELAPFIASEDADADAGIGAGAPVVGARGADNQIPKPQYVGSIPTKVITSCKRSLAGSLVDSSSSSDSEEETPRKRIMSVNLESDNATRSQVIHRAPPSGRHVEPALPAGVIRVTPLRPQCSVYMVSFKQDEPTNRYALTRPTIIREPEAGLPLDLSEVKLPVDLETLETMEPPTHEDLESCIFSERYKTVWHSTAANSTESYPIMTVPFTTNVGDIFKALPGTGVPPLVKNLAYQYAVDRSEKLLEIRNIFANNNPNHGRRSINQVDMSEYDLEDSRIVSTGSCPPLAPPSS